ncbi:MAG: M14 family zinc carboxypeptidase [candidate division WOR-3 bacterium]
MKYLFASVFSFSLLFSFIYAERKMEARVYFQTAEELFSKLGNFFSELDVATGGETETGESYIVIITTEEQLEKIKGRNLRVEITYPDIKEKFRLMTGVDPDKPELFRDFGYFFTYWEMIDTLNRMKANYPAICSIMNIGNSHQGRPLWTLKISDNPQVDELEPAVYFNGATHAREPGATHCCIDFASWLLMNYGRDSLVTWLVNNREIYFTPVMNPDGYVYNSDSGGSTANWRKNRRIIQSPYVGVDLNRNYGYKWAYDNSGSSGSPSSETYRGPARFSEPETQVARDFMLTQKIRTQLDYHTYGRYNMYSWGYATTLPPDQTTLQEVVDTFRMYNGYPQSQTGQIARVLYLANGVSTDWEYADTLHEGVRKFVTYAFTIEWGTNDFWYGASNPTYVDNENQLNRGNNLFLTKVGGVFFEPRGVFINDTLMGNRTGQLDPGENAYIWFKLRNRAINPADSAYSISGVVRSSDSRVTLIDSTFTLPVIRRKDTSNTRSAMLRISANSSIPPNTIVRLRVVLSYLDDGFAMSQPLDYSITIGPNIVSVEEEKGEGYFSCFPTIVRKSLRLSSSFLSGGDFHFRIISADGRILEEGRKENLPRDFNLEEGIYFLEVKDGTNKEIRKIVLVK